MSEKGVEFKGVTVLAVLNNSFGGSGVHLGLSFCLSYKKLYQQAGQLKRFWQFRS